MSSEKFPALKLGNTIRVYKPALDKFIEKYNLTDDRKGWRRKLKDVQKLQKGQYVVKQERKNATDKPMCSTCANCQHRELCKNRQDTKLMRKCEDCKNCINKEECDKFYISLQYKSTVSIGRDSKGNPIRKSFSAESEEQAVFKAMQYRNDYHNGIAQLPTKKQKSVYQIIYEGAKIKLDRGEIRPNTYLRYLDSLKHVKANDWANKPIGKVNRDEVENYLFSIRSYSNSTIKKLYRAIKSAFSYARTEHYINYDFFEGRDGIKMPVSMKDDKEVRALTVDEENLFINYLQSAGAMYKNIYLVSLYTGMRIGEIISLAKEDVSFRERKLYISKSVTRDINNKDIISKTKTRNGKRIIIINRNVEPVLKEAIKEMHPNENNLIFCRDNGSLYTQGMINSELKRICKKLQIRKISMHCLRHTFATRCVEAGISFKAIQGFMGHADIQTTLDTYAELQDGFKYTEMDRLDQYLDKIS